MSKQDDGMVTAALERRRVRRRRAKLASLGMCQRCKVASGEYSYCLDCRRRIGVARRAALLRRHELIWEQVYTLTQPPAPVCGGPT